jgi:acyl-CoA hydrolase
MTPNDALDFDGQLPPPRSRQGRSLTMGQALDLIPDRSRVYVTPLMGPPTAVLEAMAAEPDRWTDLETTCDYLAEPLATFAHPGAPFRHLTVQASRALAPMAEAGALRTVSGCSSQLSGLYLPGGPVAVDVAIVQVSRPGPDGRFSLGTSGGTTAELVRAAPLVLAEVNPAMPYTRGVVEFERRAFDALVEVDPHPLIEFPSAPRSETTDRIGANVASQIADGAVIEYGIGAIPDASLAALAGHRDLGLHSGMLGDAVIELVEAGVMNGRRKSVDAGLLVAAGIVGTRRAAQWAAERDDVVLVASNYSHGAIALARQDRFTAINSALQVALDGSIGAEVVGGRVVSGPGGQPDFAYGASVAADGVSIVALQATAAKGTVSRIVESIDSADRVTVPHYLADRVVTEHGVASLRGADGDQRAAALRAIAAPGLLPA